MFQNWISKCLNLNLGGYIVAPWLVTAVEILVTLATLFFVSPGFTIFQVRSIWCLIRHPNNSSKRPQGSFNHQGLPILYTSLFVFSATSICDWVSAPGCGHCNRLLQFMYWVNNQGKHCYSLWGKQEFKNCSFFKLINSDTLVVFL